VGFKPDLDDQLVSFSALTLFGYLACKNCLWKWPVMCWVGR